MSSGGSPESPFALVDHIVDQIVDEPDTEIAPWDGRRVPVTLLGGYLGVGKTTVLNHLLARTDRPIAVLVNDVGEINIDHRLIARRHGDVVELTDGCICCSLSDGLGKAFDDLRARHQAPDHLVIELSGVADPAQVVPWARSNGFRLDGVVVLVDVEQFPARLADPITGPLIRRQLRVADLALVTKTDLVDEATTGRVVAEVGRLTDGAPIARSNDPEVVAGLLDMGTRRPGGVDDTPPPSLFDAHRTSVITLSDPVDRNELDELLDALEPEVVRAKGVARMPDGERLLIQVVGARRAITPLPVAEDQQPTDLVVISLP
ncbi:MAG: CobW family GTP-binding protein [Actinomycetota bacterium]